jgi:hypothetical protein
MQATRPLNRFLRPLDNKKELNMRFGAMIWTGCLSGALVVFAAPAMAASVRECPVTSPTAESYTHDFKAEANTIFAGVRDDAEQAEIHADTLLGYTNDPDLTWNGHAIQLDSLKDEINDVETQLCRLYTIRRVVGPWQQREIDRIGQTAQLMVDNATDAIHYISSMPQGVLFPRYERNLNNLYQEAKTLTRSTGNAVEFANVSHEYRDLGHKLGARNPS